MDDEAETYKLWRIRKTIMQVNLAISTMAKPAMLKQHNIWHNLK